MAVNSLGAKELAVAWRTDKCTLLLVEGSDSAALVQALDARFGLCGAPFYLTLPEGEAVVPLSSALPSGTSLLLHVRGNAERLQQAGPPANAVPPGSSPAAAYLDAQAARDAAAAPSPAATPLLAPGEQANTDSLVFAAPSPAATPLLTPGEQANTDNLVFEMTANPMQMRSASMVSVELEHQVSQVGQMFGSIERFSRLSTDLANERTLLAWMRTGMASFRTAFAFLAVTANGGFWHSSVAVSRVAMVTVCLVAALSGVVRYVRIKRITFEPTPPQRFGRISVHWFTVLLVVSTVAMVAGMYANAWRKS